MTNSMGGADQGKALDATWMILCTFIVWTMQPGFVLLEAGFTSEKNGANVVVKNLLDCIIGGFSFWIFGYAFSFGSNSNSMSGNSFYFTNFNYNDGYHYFHYAFQLSCAVKISSIMSGAVTERIKLLAYMIMDFLNVGLIFVFPAHWMWGDNGWLQKVGALDFAGSSVIHMSGGTIALVGAIMLGQRDQRFGKKSAEYKMSKPVYALLGTLLLLMQWIGFNCGATIAMTGDNWKIASRVAVVTVNGGIGGGFAAILLSALQKKRKEYLLDIPQFVTGILGGLVGITAGSNVFRPWEGIVVGFIGGLAAAGGIQVLEFARIDDPVGAFPVHYCGGLWGMIAVGMFAEGSGVSNKSGIFRGGNGKLLGYNLLACLAITIWCAVTAGIIFVALRSTFGIRLKASTESEGSDYHEHGISPSIIINDNKGLLHKDYGSSLRNSLSNGTSS